MVCSVDNPAGDQMAATISKRMMQMKKLGEEATFYNYPI
jgi:hypothetical protein